jgi:LacI family transcriptional regulator, gluconate utilization system Gnt-I transcriptional repressor
MSEIGMRRSRHTRIVDLAREAGVSAMTVSRALRGIEGVSDAKRAEILALAKQRNYLPDLSARSMAVANSDLVGISIPTLFNDVFADILWGMRGTFRTAGFSSLVETTDYSISAEAEWIERLLSWRPAGLVLTGFDHDPRIHDLLLEQPFPIVEVWDWRPDPIDICVGIDHLEAGFQLGTHIRGLGYRRPSFIGAPEGRDARAERRLAGLTKAFDTGLNVSQPTQANAFEAGLAAGQAVLSAKTPPDVIFCLNDHVAFGALSACTMAGLDVPGDIGLVGFNGLPLASVLPVPLTTMKTPRREMGVMAARALLAKRNGITDNLSRRMGCSLVPGATTRQLG